MQTKILIQAVRATPPLYVNAFKMSLLDLFSEIIHSSGGLTEVRVKYSVSPGDCSYSV